LTNRASTEIPTDDPRPDDLRRAPSLVLVNTGNGKGKTSAAIGVVVRGVARGWPVAVVQFLKSGNWKTGEEKIAKQLGVDWFALGEGFTWDSSDLNEDQAAAAGAWQKARELIGSGAHQLVLLDEITYPINWGWIAVDDVVEAFDPERIIVFGSVARGDEHPESDLDLLVLFDELPDRVRRAGTSRSPPDRPRSRCRARLPPTRSRSPERDRTR